LAWGYQFGPEPFLATIIANSIGADILCIAEQEELQLKLLQPRKEGTLMWKALTLTALISLSGVSLANPPEPAALPPGIINSDEAEIREARAPYNNALASRNSDVISRYWLPDSQSVWASGKLTLGHDNIVARYAKTFNDADFLFGFRTPRRIYVATTAGGSDAAEVGTWKWKMHYLGQDITWSGRYLAMWQKVNGQWGLRSDLYVTTGCTGGSACR
jgi:ketosteroid isomerase-like protein